LSILPNHHLVRGGGTGLKLSECSSIRIYYMPMLKCQIPNTGLGVKLNEFLDTESLEIQAV